MKKFLSSFFGVILGVIIGIGILFISEYIFIYKNVYILDKYNGQYNPIINMYVCKNQFACEHERGHAVDYHNKPLFFFARKDLRSENEQFRKNIDATYACISTIFANYDILSEEYPKTSQSLMTIEWMTVAHNEENDYKDEYFSTEEQLYGEIYASLYAIMKLHRWDIYHYDDVENMVVEHLTTCENYLIRTKSLTNND